MLPFLLFAALESEPIPVQYHPLFQGRLQPCLRHYARQHRLKRTTFYVSPVQDETAYVYYQNRLILWEPHRDTDYTDLIHSRRQWRLPRDTAADPQGSTYLLTPEEASRRVRACLRGTEVEVNLASRRSTAPP